MSIRYDNVAQIEAVVQGFEDCSTGKEDFGHASHLTVALWYLNNSTFEQAAGKMREGLFRFLTHHQVPLEKYNETITLFWLRVVKTFAARHAGSSFSTPGQQTLPSEKLVAIANELLQSRGTSKLVFDYYSESLLSSSEAKSGWLEPDLKQFDF